MRTACYPEHIRQETDAVLREVLHQPDLLLVKTLTGAHIQTFLPEHFPSTKERVPDLVALLSDGTALHLEVMGYNDPFLGDRMWDVRGMFRRAYPDQRQLRQIVVYVGRGPMHMPGHIVEPGVDFRYALVDIRDYAAEPFLASPHIEDNLIGVLCRGGDSREYVRGALHRIAALPSDLERRDAVTKFLILSSKRGLVEVVRKESERMPFTVDLSDDPYLQKLHDEGMKEGRQEGLKCGHQDFMRKSLQLRFGPLPSWAQDAIAGASEAQLDTWLSRLHTASSLQEVLRSEPK